MELLWGTLSDVQASALHFQSALPDSIVTFWDFTDPFVMFWRSIFKLPDDMMRLAILLIATYPAALLHRYLLPGPKSRHFFSMTIGLFWMFFCYKWDALYFVGTGLGTYLFVATLPSSISPYLVVFFSFSVLSYGHYVRYVEMYLQYSISWATPMMLFCIKLHSFAWNYSDGQKPPVAPFPVKNRIEKLPNFLHYFGWLFFFPGILAGPAGEYQDYMAFTDRSMFMSEPQGKIPPSWKPALLKFLCMFLGIFGFYGAKWIPESYCGNIEFLSHPFWYRMGYLLLAVEVGFTKYYFAWFNGEAHTILIGSAYNGRSKSGKILWNRVQMLNLIPFRTANNRFGIHLNWNICSGDWLKYYIYLRIPLVIRAVVSPVVLTFSVSAFWHGFYPGYYLFFAGYAFYYLVEEAIDKGFKQRYIVTGRGRDTKPVNPTTYKIYIAVATLATWVYINSITITFRLLDWERTKIAFGSFYYWTIIVAVVLYIIFKFIIPPPPRAPRTPVTKKQE